MYHIKIETVDVVRTEIWEVNVIVFICYSIRRLNIKKRDRLRIWRYKKEVGVELWQIIYYFHEQCSAILCSYLILGIYTNCVCFFQLSSKIYHQIEVYIDTYRKSIAYLYCSSKECIHFWGRNIWLGINVTKEHIAVFKRMQMSLGVIGFNL